MKIQYEIKGITLNEYELIEIHKYYQAARTAEYIMDNYDITDEDGAMQLGYEVRELMDKYEYDEDEAIEHIVSEIGEE